MQTIVQIVQHLRPGGIETMALDLHGYFTAQGHASWIISLEGEHAAALSAWPRLRQYADRIVFLDKPDRLSPAFVLRLAAQLRRVGATSVHTHHIGPLLYGGLARPLAGVRSLVHTEHDAWHLECPRRRRLQKWLLRLLRPVLVADAEDVGKVLRDLFDPRDLRVIRNGIDTKRFTPGDRDAARQRLGLPTDVRLVGCAGRLEAVKGQAYLIRALARLPADVHLALAGHGSEELELREASDALGLAQRVHFLGRIDDMPGFYRALDCFCQPSLREGMPLAPLEAQACGAPAIVSDVGGSRECLCPHSGILIPPGDVDAIVAAVTDALATAPARSPRDFVCDHGDRDAMAQAYSALHLAHA